MYIFKCKSRQKTNTGEYKFDRIECKCYMVYNAEMI